MKRNRMAVGEGERGIKALRQGAKFKSSLLHPPQRRAWDRTGPPPTALQPQAGEPPSRRPGGGSPALLLIKETLRQGRDWGDDSLEGTA